MRLAASFVRELSVTDPRALAQELDHVTQPVVLRGLAAHWPLVRAALVSDEMAIAYLRRFYAGATVGAWRGAPDIGGRFFYNDDFSGFNFVAEHCKLDLLLSELAAHLDKAQPPAIYVGSTTVDTCLPGLRVENDLELGARESLMSIWIGNRTRIAAHYDLPDNLACVAAGRRKFTLFPPGEIDNLYVGPLDFTPAGQPISLVDFAKPDFGRFPRFSAALKNAQQAELGPGDAILIPSMWWHHVEASSNFNVLMNYWWRESPAFMDSPMNALMLAIMSVRDLPTAQREAWQALFRYYVFEATSAEHIPPHARRMLAPLDGDTARMLRAQLLNRLNR
jgi:hypothetical protein